MSKLRYLNQINEIIIHCSDTPNGRMDTAEDINAWHKARGFHRLNNFTKWTKLKHIGYHFVIHLDGSVLKGRAEDETGAHARGHNSNSIGICLIGRDKFTPAQWNSLRAVVNLMQSKYPRVDLSNIIGHREVSNHKTCPNFDVSQWLDNDKQALTDHLLTG